MSISPLSLTISPFNIKILPLSDPPYKLLQNHPSLSLLSKCKNTKSLKQCHTQFIKSGLHNTQFALSKLIEFCAVSPFGDLSYALLLFESIDEPNQVIWNNVIRGYSLSSSPHLALMFYVRMVNSGFIPNSYTFPFVLKSCSKTGAGKEGKQIHAHVFKLGLHSDSFVHTSLINMYAQLDELDKARLVFDKSSHRDAVSFTALITGYASKGRMDDAQKLFDDMTHRDVVSWNAMIAGFSQCRKFEEALGVFKEMRDANVDLNESTLLTVLSACAHSESLELGNWVHRWIDDHKLSYNLQLINGLIDMYSKCGDLDKARCLFDDLYERDVISWNVMIGGYTHMNQYKEALMLFEKMLRSNVEPNDVTLLGILPACANLGALDLGKWIHAYVDKKFCNNLSTSLSTSLVDMYAKCGNIEMAKQMFSRMQNKSLATWNAMISGFAMHGKADKAMELFSLMKEEGLVPDGITFVGILSACSHAGLLDTGRGYFSSMIKDYKISPQLQHYGCMIDLLGRAGLLYEAEAMLKSMEIEPDGAIWGSLLGSCRVHGHVDFGEFVAKKLFEIEPENPGAYILLSNIYAGAGRWDDVARIRTLLNDKGMKKVPGCTSIEVDSVVHEFLVGDKTHRKSEEIYAMLNEIDTLLEKSGFVADTSEVLYDMDEEWKEGSLSHHSEKLAIAFGLISTQPRTQIRIVKNLRVCRNCHTVTKLLSKIFNREIIARDRNRFHHFKDGVCSCNDYW